MMTEIVPSNIGSAAIAISNPMPPNSITFGIGDKSLILLTETSFTFMGKEIEDAGEARKAFLEAMRMMQSAVAYIDAPGLIKDLQLVKSCMSEAGGIDWPVGAVDRAIFQLQGCAITHYPPAGYLGECLDTMGIVQGKTITFSAEAAAEFCESQIRINGLQAFNVKTLYPGTPIIKAPGN